MEFSDMLACGLGRAVLYLQTHDATAYREAILHACTHFVGYDAQSEPSRARYNFHLITQGGDRDWYLPRLYHAFTTGEHVEMPNQLFNLMGFLAQDGNTLARMMMYDIFAEDASELDTTGAKALINLDGLDGYIFVARQWNRYPLPEEEHWYEGWLLDTVEERFGTDAVTAALAAAVDANINEEADLPAYLAEAREKRRLWKEKRRGRRQSPAPDYDTVRGLIDAPRGQKTRYSLGRAGQDADDALFSRLASDLNIETDPARVLHLLYFFARHAFPLSPHCLLELVQNGDQDVALAAQKALTHVIHPDVRAFALIQIDAGNVWYSLDMLIANPAEEDYTLMAELTQRPLSIDEFHHVGISILDYVEAHPLADIVPALLNVYENGFCSICRRSVVKHLLSLAPLPDAVLREIVWDCAEDTRMLAVPFRLPDGE